MLYKQSEFLSTKGCCLNDFFKLYDFIFRLEPYMKAY